MKSEWKNSKDYELGEVCSRLSSGKSISAKEILEFGKYPVYGGNGIRGYTDKKNFSGQCGIIGRQGAFCGNVRYFSGEAYMTEHAVVVCANEQNDTRYLVYMLSQLQLGRLSGQSAQPGLSVKVLAKQKIHLPDFETQKKIAKVLSALDDKIELNNQINKNLEEQAQALYNSWFVDFEPFGGVMPADWAQADIYSLAEVIYGAPFASKYFNNTGDGIPIIRIRDLKEQKFITYTAEKHSKGYLLQKGDIVVGMDGEFRPYIWGNSQAWLNQRVCVFKNKRPNGKAFLYYTIKPLLLAIEQTQVATTVIHIGKKDFDLFKVTLPANEILDKFDNITTPIIDQIVQNTFENKILCDIRETLLPKLMSGEIDVDNVEI